MYRGRGIEFRHLNYDHNTQDALTKLNMSENKLRQMFWLPGAAKTEIVTDVYEDNNVMSVTANWMDADGRSLGNTKRRFSLNADGTLSVRNRWLEIEQQNTGAGAILYGNQIRTLKDAGYSRIELGANSTIGRYAWARKGFDYVADDKERMTKRASRKFREWADERNVLVGAWPEFKSAKEVADFDIGTKLRGIDIDNPDVPDNATLHVGKAFMLDKIGHGEWQGELLLSE
jgi:hypothetical protein